MKCVCLFLALLLVSLPAYAINPAFFAALNSGCSDVTSDWSGYDGSNDVNIGDTKTDIRGPMDSVTLDADRSLVVYALGNTNIDLRMAIMNRTCDGVSISDEVIIDSDFTSYAYPVVEKLSDTRFIVRTRKFSTTKENFYLINLSGNTISVVDTAEFATTAFPNISNTLAVHSASLVMGTFIDSATNDLYLISVSISGDTLTINGITEIWDAISANDTATQIIELDATTGVAVNANRVSLYTISGTTPSLTDTELLFSGAADTRGYKKHGIQRVSDTEAVISFNNPFGADGGVALKGKVITNTSGTLSSGVTIDLSSVGAGNHPNDIIFLKNDLYMATSDRSSSESVVVFSESAGTLTKSSEVTIQSGSNSASHVILHNFTGSNYVVYTHQDTLQNLTWLLSSP